MNMPVLNEGKHNIEFLLTEGNHTISREQVTIAAAAPAMVSGQLLGKITASSKYTVYSNAASDGTEVVAGILLYNTKDSAADQKAAIIARHAEVREADLVGVDAAAKVDLAALHIALR
jgi:hypothetical protein